MKPLKSNILLRKELVKETESGIELPEPLQNETAFAEVVEVGDDCTVQKGDTVLIKSRAGKPIEWEGEELHMLSENGIMAIVEE